MTMRKLYKIAVVLGLTLTLSISAQNTKKADKLFNRLEYVKAAQEYLKFVENNSANNYVYKQLGDCYYNIYSPDEAVKYYEKAAVNNTDAELHFRYAQMLKAQGKADLANKQMQEFAKKAPNDKRAKDFLSNPDFKKNIENKPDLFSIKKANLSSDLSDFGAIQYGNNVYFASARNTKRKNYGWNNEPFLDLYMATYDGAGNFSEAVTIDDLNSNMHEGPLTMSKDGSTIYFSSESFKEGDFVKDKPSNSKQGQLYLYKATKSGDKWGKVTLLPFNNKNFSTANPSLSRDGKTLYFSSNRPGGQGGVDIWKVSVNGDSFGEPENLGKGINTEGDESFPFISDDSKTLYFASNGQLGLGGYDVFSYDLASKKVENLGKAINSNKDDFAFTFSQDKKMGFLSSNREGEDDIYLVDPICAVGLIVKVTDKKTGKSLAGAKVDIMDSTKKIINSYTTDANGEITSTCSCNKDHSLIATKNNYNPGSATFNANTAEHRVNIMLDPIEVVVTETEVILNPIFFEYNKHNITPQGAEELDRLVQVMKDRPEMIILAKSHTDSRGTDDYNIKLSDRRAKSTVQYIISKGIEASRITGEGKGETEPKVNCGEKCTEEEHAQNRRSEFKIVKK
jgi:outer membrane protein OmpA-like peptidoglycan-associated protein/tetratricopeptide (TPR) repeat protein